MNQVELHDGRQVDSNSEAWRHECEAAHVLTLPTAARQGYIGNVTARRGKEAGSELRNTVYRVWIARQVKALEFMDTREREEKLYKIERTSNLRTRQDVEKALMGR